MSENVPLADQQLYGINNVPLDLYKWIRKNSNSFIEKYKKIKKTDKHQSEAYATKYPWVKRKKTNYLPFIHEILPIYISEYSNTIDIDIFIENYIQPKIQGKYKHGQTCKTGLCNIQINNSIINNELSINFTKNTLLANEQWTSRFIKELKKINPTIEPKKTIIVISSKKNDLNGNATHCKKLSDALALYLAHDTFRCIFVCSNKKRFEDIVGFLDAYNNFSIDKQIPITIQIDEAHNTEDGIPSKRVYCEYILCHPKVKLLSPVTASIGDIVCHESPCWNLINLEYYAIDYRHVCAIKSSSENYSSLHDAHQISFEEYEENPNWIHYNIREFNKDLFIEAHKEGIQQMISKLQAEGKESDEIKKIIDDDINRRRQMEFCIFMNGEIKAFNQGLNLLDNYYTFTYNGGEITEHIILRNVQHLYLITTPNRVVFTIQLMKYAAQKEYNPICIGLYRSKINILYYENGEKINREWNNETNQGQFNETINEIIEDIEQKGHNTKRPFILFGNYKPTGESITMVNYKYGTLRMVAILPGISQTPEKDYQNYLRSCWGETMYYQCCRI